MGQPSHPSSLISERPFLMVEQSQAAKGHGNAVFVAGVNHLLVADGTAGLDNGGHAAAVRALNVVAEGEERVAAQSKRRLPCSAIFSFEPWLKVWADW